MSVDEDDDKQDGMLIDEPESLYHNLDTPPHFCLTQLARLKSAEVAQSGTEPCSTITPIVEETGVSNVSDRLIQGGRHPAMSLSHICDLPITEKSKPANRNSAYELETICNGSVPPQKPLTRNRAYVLETICNPMQHMMPRNTAYDLSTICSKPDEHRKPRNSAYELSTICNRPVQHMEPRNSAYELNFICNQRKAHSLVSICN